jgi:predicted nuclease of predicted toxin-antitoxin system
MNFVADESVDRQIVERLREDGHVVLYVAEMNPGITDEDVLRLSNQETAILITADKDFGDLVFRQGSITSGVLLIRLAGLSQLIKSEKVSTAISEHEAEISRAFSVISSGTIRIRRKR